uniref:V-type proton ATPase subunit F n=1 Tax=Stomoxys calcitrans TaxID=35570 RepID=A0A1I8QCX5_STOCA
MDLDTPAHTHFVMDDGHRLLIAIIADETTTVGFLLAGIGECFGGLGKKHINFMIVNKETNMNDVQKYFISIYEQSNIGVILIAADIWQHILPLYGKMKRRMLPIVLEIPIQNKDSLKITRKLN